MLKYHGLFLQFVSLVGKHYKTSFLSLRMLPSLIRGNLFLQRDYFVVLLKRDHSCNQKNLDHHIFGDLKNTCHLFQYIYYSITFSVITFFYAVDINSSPKWLTINFSIPFAIFSRI